MLQFLAKAHSSPTSECGRQPDSMIFGLNLSMGRGCSSLELSSSMEDSETLSAHLVSIMLCSYPLHVSSALWEVFWMHDHVHYWVTLPLFLEQF